MGKARTYFAVKPRYTPGSPCHNLPEATALKAAEEEKRGHERTLTGCYGEEAKAEAEKLGLQGIVEAVTERRTHWDVRDLITGDTFRRDFPDRVMKGRRR